MSFHPIHPMALTRMPLRSPFSLTMKIPHLKPQPTTTSLNQPNRPHPTLIPRGMIRDRPQPF
ncbi:hypothetical protein PCANC_01212 [Puccinia coronata f. sp. avenae]|uniref:Uncharacterized protein n=1 Tax=Puccinia coronata f. sp. avenae TaxID=200324 RepID=A0A2N5W3S1_9BASI|nr:hypothetical protein PCANC_01212 [Puccinia coronata f. sp. avenae]